MKRERGILYSINSWDGKFYNPSNDSLSFLFQAWIIDSYFILFDLLSIGLITVIGFLCIS